MPLSQVATRIIGATTTLSAPFALHSQPVVEGSIPVQAADAVYSASVQAMVNSLQHAGNSDSIERWLSVNGTGNGGLEVQVGDTGVGFDPDDVHGRQARVAGVHPGAGHQRGRRGATSTPARAPERLIDRSAGRRGTDAESA